MMYLYDYESELKAKRALVGLREELDLNINRRVSFESASTGCEMLCIVAGLPNHPLALELINVLDKPENYKRTEISTMIIAFLNNIQAHIDNARIVNPYVIQEPHN